jgi:hypothetical protein
MTELEQALRNHIATAAGGLTPAQIEALIQTLLPIILQIVALFAKTPPAPTPAP